MATSKKRLGTISGPLQPLAIAIEELHPDPANARKHNQKNLDAIKASLHAYGQRKPIVVQMQGMIVRAGNGTLEAAKALGWTHLAAVVIDEDNATASQFAIADNRTGELAEWDTETLATLLDGMDDETRELLAFDEKDMRQLMSGLEPADIVEDEAPPVPDEPVTKLGDLWILGEHRLLCGDSTKEEDASTLMGGMVAQVTVTDPPYNIDYGNIKHPKFKQRSIENDNMSGADFAKFCDAFVSQIARVCVGCVYVFGPPGPDGRIMFSSLDRAMHCSTTIVWNKDQFTLGRGKYQNKYEPCWFGWVESGSRFTGDRSLTNVWDFPRPRSSEEHPTMKPVAVMAHAIEHASLPSDVVFDPFLGSGTTLIAAEQLGRKCYGMEISPAYCDVIVKRWENLTGKQATRG
jgi:DNA modification methylase